MQRLIRETLDAALTQFQGIPSPTTRSPEADNRVAARARYEAGLALVERLSDEIRRRWYGQSLWTEDPENRAAAARAVAEQSPMPTWDKLARALGELSRQPYPPNICKILSVACPDLLSPLMVHKTLREAVNLTSRREFWKLRPEIWQAVSTIGVERLRLSPVHGAEGRDFLRQWKMAVEQAMSTPDPEVLSRQPRGPQEALPRSVRKGEGPSAVVQEEMAKIAAMLGVRS